ncbi:hypothetical protein lerEdw1_019247 [Lerista edwardsae]|nr:hypothetical protein lerEdw1_019247 [Lerista edwardsae]
MEGSLCSLNIWQHSVSLSLIPNRTTMSFLLACIFVLVQEVPARPQEKTNPAATLFQLVKQDIWEENVDLHSLSCEEQRTQVWTSLCLKNRTLTSFPECLPPLLESLDLSGNLLPELNSQDVVYLSKLQVLSLRQNNIQQVTWGPGSLSSLQFLDLSFNLLSFVPACNVSSLENLRWLSLAGNPVTQIQPRAFSCYPQLQFLNLSSTWLGKDGNQGIWESAFAMDIVHGDSTEKSGNAIRVLDLSATFLESIHQDWIKDLTSLASLYLTKMSQLRSLDAAVFLQVPKLRELHCQDSHKLSLVKTKSFSHTPHLTSLIFQNCNLSSLNPWNLSSPSNLVINLYGNPLVCHCALSWLLSKPKRIVLQRASETICYTQPDDQAASSSRSRPLLTLYDECQTQSTIYPTPPPALDKAYGTSSRLTMDTLPDTSVLPQEGDSRFFAPQSMHLTWEDTTEQDSTQADIVAYKEEGLYGSRDNPSTTAASSTASQLFRFSAKQTFVNTIEMAKQKHNTTTANPVVHPEGTLHYSAQLSLITEAVETDTSPVPNGLFIPNSMASLDQTRPPWQPPTEAISPLNVASMSTSIYDISDYEYEKGQEESMVGLCDYDPCRHLQKPCFELQAVSPCLCPGISDEFTIPDPPRLREVSEIRDTSAEIHWCAPNSAVRFYLIAYLPKGSKKNYTATGEIYATARQYTLYNLLPGSNYQVCIIASNKAGSSQTVGWNEHNAPCVNFTTKPSYKSIFTALSATSGLFLITTILLSGCLCKKCRKPHTEQYSTHLVSYKNPAFDYALK